MLTSSNRPASPLIVPASQPISIAQSTSSPTPTEQTYSELQYAYSLFNREFFGGKLPDCVLTLQRRPRMLGYYRPQRFVNCTGLYSDEIALNPSQFASQTEIGVLQTVGHEMAHLWKYHFGRKKVIRQGYHCREWGKQMIDIGLHPSNTGMPGGRRTGYQMMDYIIEGGPFDIVTSKMIADGYRFSWLEDGNPEAIPAPIIAPASPDETDGSHRWKFTCPKCGFNAWAKPNGLVDCGTCHILMPRNCQRPKRG